MEPRHTAPAMVDEYIAARPAEVQQILQAIRATIRSAAPEATERLSYGMPTFSSNAFSCISARSRTTSDCFRPSRTRPSRV